METRGSESGRLYTSDYVHDEAVTLVRNRMGTFEDAETVSNRIIGVESVAPIKLLFVDERYLDRSHDVFERYSDHDLSFTDATTIALVQAHDIDAVLSFDDDFDGIVDRLHPEALA
ncbi:type II toxin-antitoxin system VapC family toxin [Natronomonas salina]|uniref:type II toxin-antitoxin system VapC family toxin n=1 Tax=Natronomonas salina TaxID=1710540 RepID=UPI0015B407B6|nr:PIN domain-containing protein [Natronomonas salina]QLD88111.1 type II toxin-antitoxin system VapC family toxin [Natronomonas salina]